MRRRQLIQAAPALLLGGCGFELRRVASLQFHSIALVDFPARSPLAEELRTVLARSITVESSPAQAEVVLQSISDVRIRKAVAYNASGQVRDVQLRTLFKYRAHTPAQKELIAATEILLIREMTTVESKTLGKEQEEQQLYREMQSEMVLQVMLRLSAIRLG
jgi:LPS-assembly lipoprotein